MKRPGKSDCAARRSMLRVAVAAALSVSVGAAVSALAQVPAMPSSPQTITIVDVAGNLALTQDAIDAYVKKNPKLVGKVNYTKAPAPELPGKLKAMQGAGRSDIDLVLTGTDFLAAGIEQGVLMKLMPVYSSAPSTLIGKPVRARRMPLSEMPPSRRGAV